MDKLMKALECCAEFACGECPYQKYESTDYILKCSHKVIADLAAADLKLERHGHWIFKEGSIYATCSACNRSQAYVYDQDTYQRYCGCCGAKMSLKEN